MDDKDLMSGLIDPYPKRTVAVTFNEICSYELDAYCRNTQKRKGDVVKEAVAEYLRNRGYTAIL